MDTILETRMAKNTEVTTAAELAAMTPAERQQHFEDSLLRPEELDAQQTKRLFAYLDDVRDRNQGKSQRAS